MMCGDVWFLRRLMCGPLGSKNGDVRLMCGDVRFPGKSMCDADTVAPKKC